MKKYILGFLVLMAFFFGSVGVGIAIKNNAINNVDRKISLLTKEINKTGIDINKEKSKLDQIRINYAVVKNDSLVDKTIDELKNIAKESKPKTIEDVKKDLGEVQNVLFGLFIAFFVLIVGFKVANEFDLIDL